MPRQTVRSQVSVVALIVLLYSVDEQTPNSRQPVGIAKYTVNIQHFMPMLQPFELVSGIHQFFPEELDSSQKAKQMPTKQIGFWDRDKQISSL